MGGDSITTISNCSANTFFLPWWQAAVANRHQSTAWPYTDDSHQVELLSRFRVHSLGFIVSFAGLKAEKEGLKASEKSDSAVRDAADKVIHKTSEAASKVDEKSGGFFGGLKHWLADR